MVPIAINHVERVNGVTAGCLVADISEHVVRYQRQQGRQILSLSPTGNKVSQHIIVRRHGRLTRFVTEISYFFKAHTAASSRRGHPQCLASARGWCG